MKFILNTFLLLLFSLSTFAQSFTFSVDMSLYSGTYTDVQFYRGGSFNNMTDIGNNIYEYTVSVPPFQQSNYTYKFAVDGVEENLVNTQACVTSIPDNRYGLYTKSVPCVFITHQLQIKSPILQTSR